MKICSRISEQDLVLFTSPLRGLYIYESKAAAILDQRIFLVYMSRF